MPRHKKKGPKILVFPSRTREPNVDWDRLMPKEESPPETAGLEGEEVRFIDRYLRLADRALLPENQRRRRRA
jgi:hypothetical protein